MFQDWQKIADYLANELEVDVDSFEDQSERLLMMIFLCSIKKVTGAKLFPQQEKTGRASRKDDRFVSARQEFTSWLCNKLPLLYGRYAADPECMALLIQLVLSLDVSLLLELRQESVGLLFLRCFKVVKFANLELWAYGR